MIFQNTFLLGLGNKNKMETPILRSKKSKPYPMMTWCIE
jgi:hypothetical protein